MSAMDWLMSGWHLIPVRGADVWYWVYVVAFTTLSIWAFRAKNRQFGWLFFIAVVASIVLATKS